MPFTKEDVEVLAFRRYKESFDEPLEKTVWYLAELCVTINKNIVNGYDVKPLETDNLVLMIRPDVNGEVIQPVQDEVSKVAEIIYNEEPSKAQLHWYIAEKTLLLDEIKSIISAHVHKK